MAKIKLVIDCGTSQLFAEELQAQIAATYRIPVMLVVDEDRLFPERECGWCTDAGSGERYWCVLPLLHGGPEHKEKEDLEDEQRASVRRGV